MIWSAGRGHPAGQRPGFLYGGGQAEQAVADAYAQYDAEISGRWQSQRWRNSAPPSRTPSAPQVFDSPQAAVGAAYAQYDKDIAERWRR